MRLFYTHPSIDICMKRRKVVISMGKKCVFCLQFDSEAFVWVFRRDQITWNVFESHIHRRHGNTYFECVFIFLEVSFTEVRASVTLFAWYCFYITILWKLNIYIKMEPYIYFCSVRHFEKYWLLKIEHFHKTKFDTNSVSLGKNHLHFINYKLQLRLICITIINTLGEV